MTSTTVESLLGKAGDLAAHFAAGAPERERTRRSPVEEFDEIHRSGILAATVPTEFGGPGGAPSVGAEIVRILSTADGSIGQVPQNHFAFVRWIGAAGTAEQKERLFAEVLNGGHIANAQAERHGRTAADTATTLTYQGDGTWLLRGTKYYATGSPFATYLAVTATVDEDADGVTPGVWAAFIPKASPGITVVDDWDAVGQRLTGSGTVTLDNVVVTTGDLISRDRVWAAGGYGAYSQLLHVGIDTGIARGTLTTGLDIARRLARPWTDAEVERAVDDPLTLQNAGELEVAVFGAEAAFASAGRAVDELLSGERDDRAEVSLHVAKAKIIADAAVLTVSTHVFELTGTRATAPDLQLDRFWRNARTHTLHDPVRWKKQHIGRYVLRGQEPPLGSIL
ncbi:acyl-CoA dehydrogenase family protein [uncultured Corynebacterium sp.]|uniref:acyl-CoA dehydrogenase family protein n=1 Tax=uncultured Corynebacterium sp. TaxID=159447 RepID=UPI0025EEF9E2|nr:acyl-CoA dehydrogenase family protein [uncultured Corynebacterium sp.]